MHSITELLVRKVRRYQRWNHKRNSNKDRHRSGQKKWKLQRQTMIDIILQGILKIEKHEPHMKSGRELRCSGRKAVPSPLVATILLLFA